ncbi:hypothetical protein K3495_g13116 [Podosphaera aphanis]|nr:hypothetical protein K3495_g13116 [Podosphaera aphanis]
MHITSLLISSLTFITAYGAVIERRGPTCTEFKIPATITSDDINIGTSIDSQAGLRNVMQNALSGILNLLTKASVSGTFNIAARYCEPEVQNPARANTIQILVHGITYSKDYWSGLGSPGAGFNGDTYSHIAFASKQGYPTLSIDRLGNGDSDRPDGTTVVQINTHVEVTQSIISSLKAGSIGGRAFNKIIYVGHWYGSLIGNLHAVKYPDAVDSYVLTGFSKKIKSSLLPTALAAGFLPASVAYPERWAGQQLSYFAASNETGANGLFFVDQNVDPGLKTLNYRLRGTVTAGEFISGYETTQVASNYRGRIFIQTGQNDAIFCSPDDLGQGTLNGRGDCGTGENSIVAQTRDQYPAASVFDYDTPANTGHCNILHTNAQAQFQTVHDWLARFY